MKTAVAGSDLPNIEEKVPTKEMWQMLQLGVTGQTGNSLRELSIFIKYV